MDITDLLISAKFSPYDLLLIYFCPVAGIIGGFAHAFLVDSDWSKIPPLEFTEKSKKEEKKLRASTHSGNIRVAWVLGRLLLGGVVGLGVMLFFLGSVIGTIPASSKVLLISLIGGFSAPKILGHIDANIVAKIQRALIDK